jgi:hypothetical protein
VVLSEVTRAFESRQRLTTVERTKGERSSLVSALMTFERDGYVRSRLVSA